MPPVLILGLARKGAFHVKRSPLGVVSHKEVPADAARISRLTHLERYKPPNNINRLLAFLFLFNSSSQKDWILSLSHTLLIPT